MTSVEWLFEKLWQLPKDKFTWYNVLEQAKEIEKQQIMKAYYDGQGFPANKTQQINYYNETFGSKGSGDTREDALKFLATQAQEMGLYGTSSQTEISINELKSICQSVIDNTPSDATEKEIGYTKAMEHIIKIIGGEPHKYPQTEISDEEIEKAIIHQDVVKQEGYCHCFLEGAKWYREQLKKK